MSTMRERIEQDTRLFDSAILRHGYADYMRDYDVLVETTKAKADRSGSEIEGHYRYRFTHCPSVHLVSTLPDESWQTSWDDVLIDFAGWQEAGEPAGFVWGVCWANAYPGMRYISQSEAARDWSSRLGKEMHEVAIKTNVFELTLTFHDLVVERVPSGTPA